MHSTSPAFFALQLDIKVAGETVTGRMVTLEVE